MNTELKQRMVGASVIIALAVIFIPMLFDDTQIDKNQVLSIEIPQEPVQLQHKLINIDGENNSDNLSGSTTNTREAENSAQNPDIKPAIEKQETILDVVDNSSSVNDSNKPDKIDTAIDTKKSDSKEVAIEKFKENKGSSLIQDKPDNKPDMNTDNQDGFRLKFGVFSKQKNAQQLKAQLINKGYDAVITKDIEKEVYKVYSTIFNEKSAAEKLIPEIVNLKLKIGKPVVEALNSETFDSLLDTGWILQIGIYSSKDNALKQRNQIRKSGFVCFVDEISVNKKLQYRVRVGPYATRDEAASQQSSIQSRMKLKSLIKPHEKQKVVGP